MVCGVKFHEEGCCSQHGDAGWVHRVVQQAAGATDSVVGGVALAVKALAAHVVVCGAGGSGATAGWR